MADCFTLTPEQEERLQDEYANQYIAWCDGEVIAASESIWAVIDQADVTARGKKYVVRFVPGEDLLVLNLSR